MLFLEMEESVRVIAILRRRLTLNLAEGKTFQNLRVSSPAPVTIVFKNRIPHVKRTVAQHEISITLIPLLIIKQFN